MASYVEFKIGKRVITLWDPRTFLIPTNEEIKKCRNAKFIADMKKWIYAEKKEMKAQEQRNLDYLGIDDKNVLNRNVNKRFKKFLDSIDKTEIARKKKEIEQPKQDK